jgi:nicotinamidase-related amidase
MDCVLLLIDVQRNMLEPPTPVPAADAVSARIDDLLGRARSAGSAIVHVRNNGAGDDPDAPGSAGWELTHQAEDGEPIVDKYETDAFAGTALADLIPATAAIVVAGMQSEYCIRATSLAALRRGHQVTLAAGAHATYDDGDASELGTAGVAVIDASDVTFS